MPNSCSCSLFISCAGELIPAKRTSLLPKAFLYLDHCYQTPWPHSSWSRTGWEAIRAGERSLLTATSSALGKLAILCFLHDSCASVQPLFPTSILLPVFIKTEKLYFQGLYLPVEHGWTQTRESSIKEELTHAQKDNTVVSCPLRNQANSKPHILHYLYKL